MVQESTMICIDNSEWMRNGDFTPTRLQCQQEAANLIMQCKLRANPENAVGILAMAETVEVLSTMTQENGRLFMKLHQIEPKGESNFVNGIKVAHLALKHRQNRNHKMRIVVFVGSPIDHLDVSELTKMAKKLKKEKVQLDVICFGEADTENSEIMGQMVETLNGREAGGGSNMVAVSGGSTLTDALLSSPICRGEDGAGAPVVGAGGGGFEFGIDPEDDPDLALALRVSLEEQRQRQQQEGADAGAGAGAGATAGAGAGAEGGQGQGVEGEQMDTGAADVMSMDPGTMTEEQQLEWALRMSMQEGAEQGQAPRTPLGQILTQGQGKAEGKAEGQGKAEGEAEGSNETMEVDEEQSATVGGTDMKGGERKEEEATEDEQLGQLMSDPELLRQLVADLPGVDPNSQEIEDAVNNAAEQSKEARKDEKSK